MSAGSPAWMSASRSITRSTTVTVFVPDCLRMVSDTADSPSSVVSLRISSMASVTRATSSRRMTEPSR